MLNQLKKIGEKFGLFGNIQSYMALDNGKVNLTYKITYTVQDEVKSYIFQKINTDVFKNPIEVMKNIEQVTSYIRQKFPNETTLNFHYTDTGENYYCDKDGNFWRVMDYIDSISFKNCEGDFVSLVGEVIGEFQVQLLEFDKSLLYETIPDFHNTRKRIETLETHLKQCSEERLQKVKTGIDFILSVKEMASKLSDDYAKGVFPIRVTHNDTKCSNVLFDRVTHKPTLIDFDTIMAGMAMYDFGDAVRSIAVTENHLNLEKFKAFCSGYFSKTREYLTQSEIENMILGAFSVTVELSARYLDDYITGDRYFSIENPEQNLERAECLLTLAKDILSKYNEMQKIVIGRTQFATTKRLDFVF